MKQRTRCFVILAALAAATQLPCHAQTPAATQPAVVASAAAQAPGLRTDSEGFPSRNQCTPVTPQTKVPWIDVADLPPVEKDPFYWKWCTDRDTAWTKLSYPDPKFEPQRTPEHQARVKAFLQGLKDYVRADFDSDDWVGYVNEWLGAELPQLTVEQSAINSDGLYVAFRSTTTEAIATKYKFDVKLLSISGSNVKKKSGSFDSKLRRTYITGINKNQLCVTSVDLQQAFDNQSWYLFRPISVRMANRRPSAQEIEKLGGQWWGYEIHTFARPNTGDLRGRIDAHFGFQPCASEIIVNLDQSQFQGGKK